MGGWSIEDENFWYWRAMEGETPAEISARVAEALASGVDPNQPTPDGGSPLCWATRSGNLDIVRQLLLAAAIPDRDLDELPRHEQTCLHAAVENGDVLLLHALLRAPYRKIIDSFDYISRTALMIAAEKDDAEMVQVLIDAGADVNAFDDAKIGDNAIYKAAKDAGIEVVRLLLEAGADPSIPCWMMQTAFDRAQERGGKLGKAMLGLMHKYHEH